MNLHENNQSIMTDRRAERAAWIRAAAAYLITSALFYAYTVYSAPLSEMADGIPHLDVQWGGYTFDMARDYLTVLGTEGRAFYAKTTLFDAVWPLGIAVSAVLMAPIAFHTRRIIILATFFPVAFGVLDLIENVGLWTMLAQYPELSPRVVSATNMITVTKQAMIPGATIAFVLLPIVASIRALKKG